MESTRQRDQRIRAEIEARNKEPLGVRGWLVILGCILAAPFLFLIALLPELLIAPFK